MAKPQSKERLGTAVLLIITWILVMSVIFMTKCGSDRQPDVPDTVPVDSAEITVTNLNPDSVSENETQHRGKTGKKKKNKKNGNINGNAKDKTRNPLDQPVKHS